MGEGWQNVSFGTILYKIVTLIIFLGTFNAMLNNAENKTVYVVSGIIAVVFFYQLAEYEKRYHKKHEHEYKDPVLRKYRIKKDRIISIWLLIIVFLFVLAIVWLMEYIG